jgi:NAD(P)-dependent dehydrogenase (short-subunit alcohol dehydrogenase family)
MILVTGGSGFIGSSLVDQLLARGDEVLVLDSMDDFYPRQIKEENLAFARQHEGFSFVEGDIRDHSLVRQLPGEIDAIVNLAARAGVRPSLEQPVLYADVNVLGISVLLDFARERGIRPFVFASSSSVYGNNERVPFRESDPETARYRPKPRPRRPGNFSATRSRTFTELPVSASVSSRRTVLGGVPISRFGSSAGCCLPETRSHDSEMAAPRETTHSSRIFSPGSLRRLIWRDRRRVASTSSTSVKPARSASRH